MRLLRPWETSRSQSGSLKILETGTGVVNYILGTLWTATQTGRIAIRRSS